MMKLLILACCALAGCATTTEIQTKVIAVDCVWTKPIFVSQGDILTDKTAEAILEHNNTGRERCGWKPPKKGPTK
jgi:type IV pilus biogenesis protein CpaD/CtpE